MEMTKTPYSTAYTTITLPLTDEALDLLEDRGYSELLSDIKKVRADKTADNDVYGELIIDFYPDTNEIIFHFSTTFVNDEGDGINTQLIAPVDFDPKTAEYFTGKAVERLAGDVYRINGQTA